MRTEIIVFQMDNPKYTLADVAKSYPKPRVMQKELNLQHLREDTIATIFPRDPDQTVYFK